MGVAVVDESAYRHRSFTRGVGFLRVDVFGEFEVERVVWLAKGWIACSVHVDLNGRGAPAEHRGEVRAWNGPESDRAKRWMPIVLAR